MTRLERDGRAASLLACRADDPSDGDAVDPCDELGLTQLLGNESRTPSASSGHREVTALLRV